MRTAGLFIATIVLIAGSSCRASDHGRPVRRQAALGGCAPIRGWLLPDGEVETSQSDNRTEQELVTQARISHILLAATASCLTSDGAFPATLDELSEVNAVLPDTLAVCELEASALVDAWGTPVRYAVVNSRPHVVSAGADRRFGTRDDIGSPGATGRFSKLLVVPGDCR